MSKDIEKDIRCSFCGKTQDEVMRLVEGPGVYICDGCINFCSSLLFDEKMHIKKRKRTKSSLKKYYRNHKKLKQSLMNT